MGSSVKGFIGKPLILNNHSARKADDPTQSHVRELNNRVFNEQWKIQKEKSINIYITIPNRLNSNATEIHEIPRNHFIFLRLSSEINLSQRR